MRNQRIAILDYDTGNIKSLTNAVKKLGGEAILTRDKEEVLDSDGLILPGVGAFARAMEKLDSYKLIDVIKEFVYIRKKHLLGICLGMQLLFEESEEFGLTQGLGLIKGRVVKMPIDTVRKLPHVQWNELKISESKKNSSNILNSIPDNSRVYFIHSFVGTPAHKGDVLSTTVYNGYEFCSSVENGNIHGCQYHPEKSANTGLRIFKNFIEITKTNG